MVEQDLFQSQGGGSIPTSPLQLKLVEIKAQTASMLNEKWHRVLPKIHWSCIVRNTHRVCYAICFNEKPIGVAIWSSPVAQNRFADGKTMLELRRLALSDECPKNTASRVISIMIKLIRKKFPQLTRLISYQDCTEHTGTIYKAAGWKAVTKTKLMDWTTKTRKRSSLQSKADKIRWEFMLIRNTTPQPPHTGGMR
jgi:hypothetical protein